MAKNHEYSAFRASLDANTQEVLAQMDRHENLGHDDDNAISHSMLQMLSRLNETLDQVAQRLAGADAEQEDVHQHMETLLLILSFAPNSGAHWFLNQLIGHRPDVYEYIYDRVVAQKPLQMHGKLLRERLYFFKARDQVTKMIFAPEISLALSIALKEMRRA